MPNSTVPFEIDPQQLVEEISAYIERAVDHAGGSTAAIRPSHRVKFAWPPHPVSYEYHVLTSDWTGRATFEAYGDTFEVVVAKTAYGVFGRCEEIWHEARGDDEELMLRLLRETSEPLFQRQLKINAALERPGRFKGTLRDLGPVDWLKLLYCQDRDVANEAHLLIESLHDRAQLLPGLIKILIDDRHPYRRSAQWCVLDLFEDLPSFCRGDEDEVAAVNAMQHLLMTADDDYARTVYKAGVVLGGHIPHRHGAEALLECLNSPQRVGRRSAIHGCFHVVEWLPEQKATVIRALEEHAALEDDEQLAEFSQAMIRDIQKGGVDHTPEPVFPEER